MCSKSVPWVALCRCALAWRDAVARPSVHFAGGGRGVTTACRLPTRCWRVGVVPNACVTLFGPCMSLALQSVVNIFTSYRQRLPVSSNVLCKAPPAIASSSNSSCSSRHPARPSRLQIFKSGAASVLLASPFLSHVAPASHLPFMNIFNRQSVNSLLKLFSTLVTPSPRTPSLHRSRCPS